MRLLYDLVFKADDWNILNVLIEMLNEHFNDFLNNHYGACFKKENMFYSG